MMIVLDPIDELTEQHMTGSNRFFVVDVDLQLLGLTRLPERLYIAVDGHQQSVVDVSYHRDIATETATELNLAANKDQQEEE